MWSRRSFGKRSLARRQSTRHQKRRRGGLRARGRLRLEPLEQRRMLSAGGNEQLTGLFGFESDVAVDPNNPLVVATSQFQTVLISQDGGRTFPTTVNLNAPPPYVNTFGGDPTLSFDSQGNLYFGYLSNNLASVNPAFPLGVFAAVINPLNGAVLQNTQVAAEAFTFDNDKEWVAADHWEDSPFRDNAYMVWSQGNNGVGGSDDQIMFSRTTNGGAIWSAAVPLNPGGQGFVWPSEVSVARNGDVWAGWHTNTGNLAGNLGGIAMRYSSDGGVTFQPQVTPFPAGTADITDNTPPNPLLPGNRSWMQGAVQPRILLDPIRPNNIYVIAVDDPDNNYAAGDPADIVMARSTDYGASWTRTTISHGPFGTIQTMPSAAIDEDGSISVMWYDSRNGQPSVGVDQIPGNGDDNLLLDLYATVSLDGGLTWSNDFQVNEIAFDPDLGPPTDRWPPNNIFRIGEYNGHDADSGYAFVSWTANSGNNQDIAFDVFSVSSAFPDRFEENDTRQTATVLGSNTVIHENALTIHPGDSADDEDFFLYTAHDTGKIVVHLDFFHEAGDLNLQIQDTLGNQIALASSTTDDETLTTPVVRGEDYVIRVFGVGGNTNHYDLEIENFFAPVPSGVHLDPTSDTGMMANDNITADNTPTFFIQADLREFAAEGIPIDPVVGNPGADVFLQMAGVNTGNLLTINAAHVAGNFLWRADVTPAVVDDVYLVSAFVRMTDGQAAAVTGDSQLSESILVTIDTAGPKGMVLETFSADLTGAQEVPPVGTLAGGNARLWLNPARNRLEMTIELAGLDLDGLQTPNDATDDVTGLHIHRAAPGVNGPVVFGLITPNDDLNGDLVIDPVSGRISTAWDLNEGFGVSNLATELANLASGNLYINVHTPALPGGEVRGQILPAGGALKMLQSSDTGMSFIDDVTSKMAPAFTGKAEANAKVRVLAENTTTGIVNLVGQGVVGTDYTDGVPDNGFGIWEVTVEPMADGPYEIYAEFEDLAGNVSRAYDFVAQAPPLPIQDDGLVAFDIPVQHLFGNVADIDVKLDITHTSVNQLTVSLISPAGTPVTLFSNIDGSDDDFTGTILDDEAATAINTGTAPYTGSFRPEAPAQLSAFDGENPNGVWTLTVVDGTPGGGGTIDSVRLCITTDAGLSIEIDSVAPNLAFLDLEEISDSGRHDDDNVTFDNTPSVTMTSEDPNSQFHTLFTDNLKFRIYDRFEETEEFLLYDSAKDGAVDAISTIGDLYTSLQLVLETLPDQYAALIGTNAAVLAGGVLADGFHNLKLEVEDRAGNISHDFLLDVLVDTVEPPVSFGQSAVNDDGLHPDSDSDVSPPNPHTEGDRITNDTTPMFWGRAEADSIVRIYADSNSNGTFQVGADVYLGQTTAIPLDGDDAEPDGYWEIQSIVDLNDRDFFTAMDGLRTIFVTAEDLAGNVNPSDALDVEVLEIFIDTQGPQIDAVYITDNPDTADDETNYDLFDPKPSEDGPTPLVYQLSIDVRDLPERVADDFLYQALKGDVAEHSGHYLVVGDANGVIPILDVEWSPDPDPPDDGDPAFGTIIVSFVTPGGDGVFGTPDDVGRPLPDDRFTLTVSDSIVDPAGNRLDGESNAVEPQENPQFPTGDGVPGGDFVARFTVDSRAELGTWAAGSVYVDTNGNFIFDPKNLDYTNRDIVYTMGFTTDDIFAGNFAAKDATDADGFDKLAAYGQNQVGTFRWVVDVDNDGVGDIISPEPVPPGLTGLGTPVAGNFDGDPDNGDEVGLFNGEDWFLDADRDFIVSDEAPVSPGLIGYPIVGDFDGDGADDLATYLAGVFSFDLAGVGGLGDGINASFAFSFLDFIGVRERPVAADMNGDGIDDVGLWVPDRAGATPQEGSEWFFLLSGGDEFVPDGANDTVLDRIVAVDGLTVVEFTPYPFGRDLFAQFGDDYAAPIVGNFDPPVAGTATTPPSDSFTLHGTDLDDTFEVSVDALGQWTVVRNGVDMHVAPEVVYLTIDGLGGSDTITVTGSDGDDVLDLSPGQGTLTGDGYSLVIRSLETVAADGGGGLDVAFLRDNAAGKDTFTGDPAGGSLSGDGYENQVSAFRYVHVFGTAGHADAAFLHGDPDAQDTFKASPGETRLYGDGYFLRVKDIPYVEAYGTPGGADVAFLNGDSAALNTFEGGPDGAQLSGDGYSLDADSFRYIHAYAEGGEDVAILRGDPNRFDKLDAGPDQARLFGADFFLRAKSFRYVDAHATPGGGDLALLRDDATDDAFTAWPDRAELVGPEFSLRTTSFGYVHAYATAGADVATLYGSANRDVFVANGRAAKIRSADFFNRAVSFEQVHAYGRGGRDVAVLHDAVLETGLTDPAGASQVAWLYEFERIRQKSDGGETITDATDEIFTSYWT